MCYLDSKNTIFNVTVDVGVREITCHFLNGPLTSATCTIQYGTDPTYVNLPNTDSSTDTNVNSVTVPLNTPLQTDTLYYYVVSSMGVQMQGTFHSGIGLYITTLMGVHCMSVLAWLRLMYQCDTIFNRALLCQVIMWHLTCILCI